jgi:hypothetical protein
MVVNPNLNMQASNSSFGTTLTHPHNPTDVFKFVQPSATLSKCLGLTPSAETALTLAADAQVVQGQARQRGRPRDIVERTRAEIVVRASVPLGWE